MPSRCSAPKLFERQVPPERGATETNAARIVELIARRFSCLFDIRERTLQVRPHILTKRRYRNRFFAVDQPSAQLPLEGFDPIAQGRLRDLAVPSRAREIELFAQHEKVVEMAQFHGPSAPSRATSDGAAVLYGGKSAKR